MVETDVYAELASRMKYPKSERLRSIFKKLVTPEEAKILVEKCFGCGTCVVNCPVEGALRLEPADRVAAL